MKTTLAAFFLLLLTAAGCSHKEDSVAPASAAGTTFPEIIASGNWVVTSYTQGTEDKTNSMSGIRFTFDKNGQATAAVMKLDSSDPAEAEHLVFSR